MADKTQLDPALARQANERLRNLGKDFANSVAQLQSAADRYDGSWGGDEFGKTFEKGYAPNAAETLKNLSTYSQNLCTTADQVDQAVNGLEKTDQNN
jgi:uncharacterized protein YukE